MDKYLKQKIKRKPVDPLERHMNLMEGIKQLDRSPVPMNSDLAERVVKDLPVDRIKSESVPVKSLNEFQAEVAKRQALDALKQPDNVLDYSDWLKKPKAADLPEKTINYNDIRKDYNKMKKAGKGLGKLGMIGGLVGAGLAGSASDAMADVLVPGGVEGAGAGSDLPVQDDTAQINMLADSSTDPNIRRMALQELRNRGRQ
jgi:hypothetical protein